MELKLVEDNRVLQQMVMRTDTEKKRLSMENEQLSWKMSQSFIGGSSRDFTSVLNTPEGKQLRQCFMGLKSLHTLLLLGPKTIYP